MTQNALRIYTPDGSTCHTRRIEESQISSLMAAGGDCEEAKLLAEFIFDHEGIPKTLADGTWSLESEGEDEFGPYCRYVRK